MNLAQRIRPTTWIAIGFISIIVLIVGLIITWVQAIDINEMKEDKLVLDQRKTHLISIMVKAAHSRANSLYKMATMDDPFDRDDEFMLTREQADKFLTAREELLSYPLSPEERQSWDNVATLLKRTGGSTHKIIMMINNDERDVAYQELTGPHAELQNNLINELEKLHQYQQSIHLKELDNLTRRDNSTYQLIGVLAFATILLCILTVIVTRRSLAAERDMLAQGERIRSLYEVISASGMTIDEQINEILKLGCKYLGVQFGVVSMIDVQANTKTVLNAYSSENQESRVNTIVPLDKSFCTIVYSQEKPLYLDKVIQSEYKNHPGYLRSKLETYAAALITVNGNQFGTVSFSSHTSRKKPFSDSDKDLVKLISQWVSVSLERKENEKNSIEKESAIRASHTKSDFLANMSHEIRTPLTAIIGFSEEAMNPTITETQRDKAMATVVRNSKHLLSLINNILDFSKVEAGKIDINKESFSVVELLSDIETLIKMPALEKGLEFSVHYSFPIPEMMNSDETRIRQILLNLCSNAIKFTESGHIRIDVAYDDLIKEMQFTVIDTGIGLTSEQSQRIFESFTQAEASTTKRFGGTGLGLTLSKRFADLLGGSLSVESKIGKGSKFKLSIDPGIVADSRWLSNLEQATDEQQPQTNNAVPQANTTGHVLVVDDNEDNQNLIRLYLRKMGITCNIAINGEEGVYKAHQDPYDLILMDMQMPVMDGVTAVRKLRSAGNKTPIIMLTANAVQSEKDKCFTAGCDDFITKPINRQQFEEKLTGHLNVKGEDLTSQILDGDPEIQSMVDEYIDGLGQVIATLQEAQAEDNWEEVRFHVHDLKSTGGGFGFPIITEKAVEVETSIKAAHYDEANRQMNLLIGMLRKVISNHQANNSSPRRQVS